MPLYTTSTPRPSIAHILPAKRKVLRVDATRLELVTSAVRSQYHTLLEVSRVCKILAKKHVI